MRRCCKHVLLLKTIDVLKQTAASLHMDRGIQAQTYISVNLSALVYSVKRAKAMVSIEQKEREDIAYFKSIPWCLKYLDDPNVVSVSPPNRRIKGSGEDNLFAKTLNTADTISNFIVIYRQPEAPDVLVKEIRVLLTLNGDVDGWPGVCHGGIVAAILDESVGLLIPINKDCEAIAETCMTAYLNTTFLRPVPTPSTILITCKFIRIEGRKYFCEAAIEDGSKNVLATASVLFIELKGNNPRL
jgi:acyl-coenzyme A thioesterase PaaI-like protein